MSDTYYQKSKKKQLSLSLTDLGFDHDSSVYSLMENDIRQFYIKLVLYTPTAQSHQGLKFKDYSGISKRTTDKFIRDIINSLGVHNVYFFSSYNSRKKENDYYDSITSDAGSFLCAYCDGAIKDAIYGGVRNALAHGNVLYDKSYYYLYSVQDEHAEYTSNIKFLLKIKRLSSMKAFCKVLEKYR